MSNSDFVLVSFIHQVRILYVYLVFKKGFSRSLFSIFTCKSLKSLLYVYTILFSLAISYDSLLNPNFFCLLLAFIRLFTANRYPGVIVDIYFYNMQFIIPKNAFNIIFNQ